MPKSDDPNGKVWVPLCAITFDPNALDDVLKTTAPQKLSAGTGGPQRTQEKGRKGRRGG